MGWDRPRDQGSGPVDRPPPEQDKPSPPEPADRPEPVLTDRLPEKEEPSGERLLETATDNRSSARQLEKVFYERGDDVADTSGYWIDTWGQAFGDRPTGQPGTVQRDYPMVSEPKYGVDNDHVAGLALLAALTIIKVYELATNKVKAWKERGDAGE